MFVLVCSAPMWEEIMLTARELPPLQIQHAQNCKTYADKSWVDASGLDKPLTAGYGQAQALSDGPLAPGSLLLARHVVTPSPFCRQQNESSVFVSFVRQGRLIRTEPDCPEWESACISLIYPHSFVTHKQTHTQTHGSRNPLLWSVDIIYRLYLSPTWPGAFSAISTGNVPHYTLSLSLPLPLWNASTGQIYVWFISSFCNSFVF